MVACPTAADKVRIDSERNQGRAPDMAWLDHDRLGFNYRLTDIACAIGLAQLERLDELLSARARVATPTVRTVATIRSTASIALRRSSIAAPTASGCRRWRNGPGRRERSSGRDQLGAGRAHQATGVEERTNERAVAVDWQRRDVLELLESHGSPKTLAFTSDVPGLDAGLSHAGPELDFDLTAEAIDGGIWVRGTVSGRYRAECRRCLAPRAATHSDYGQ